MIPMTRLPPSPTGALHLGNARTFLVNWLLARQNNWRIILRMEDLDGPRVKKKAADEAMEDLRWLGIDWDEGPIYQSSRSDRYQRAIDELMRRRLAYPCVCSRREAESAASAPHAGDQSAIYAGTCRGRFSSIEAAKEFGGREPAIRFRVPDEVVKFNDQFAGKCSFDATGSLGDFVIAKADGTPAYQLAVVVDDHEMNVSHIVRGADLLESTARQLLLLNALYPEQPRPTYIHLPLIIGEDGRRLAKRHGDSRLSHYRSMGVTVERILALLARWIGMDIEGDVTLAEMVRRFDLSRVPRAPIVFTQNDELVLLRSRRA